MADLPPFLVLKMGGSLFADKQREGAIDQAAIAGLASQVADLWSTVPGRLVLVTGGGSLGHAAVRAADPADRFPSYRLIDAIAAVRWQWTEALVELGVPALPLQLTSMCVCADDDELELDERALQRVLAAGGLPVLSGDCVITSHGVLTTVSSDRVPLFLLGLAEGPTRVVVLSDVPGVLSGAAEVQPAVLEEVDATRPHRAYDALRSCPPWDTSRAMHGKLRALVECARRGAEAYIGRGDPHWGSIRFLLEPYVRWPDDGQRTRIACAVSEARTW